MPSACSHPNGYLLSGFIHPSGFEVECDYIVCGVCGTSIVCHDCGEVVLDENTHPCFMKQMDEQLGGAKCSNGTPFHVTNFKEGDGNVVRCECLEMHTKLYYACHFCGENFEGEDARGWHEGSCEESGGG